LGYNSLVGVSGEGTKRRRRGEERRRRGTEERRWSGGETRRWRQYALFPLDCWEVKDGV
jgi:hypothetical protein